MHRGVHASVVLTPLIIGLGFLLFALFTEYWTSLDFSQVKKYEKNVTLSSIERTVGGGGDQLLIKYRNNNYYLRRHRIEFPKYTSLFGECNEYKLMEILEPVPTAAPPHVPKSSSGSDSTTTQSIEATTTVPVSETLKSADNTNVCLTREECQAQMGGQSSEENSCFCCSRPQTQQQGGQSNNNRNEDEEEGIQKQPQLQKCCYPNSKVCDIYHDCMDKSSDSATDCPSRKLFYSTQSHDSKHNCLRNTHNIWQFLLKSAQKPNDFLKLFKSNSYSVRIFLLRLLTLSGLALCIAFTILCLITMLFVICCRNLSNKQTTTKSSTSKAILKHQASSASINRNNELAADTCAVVDDVDDDDFNDSESKLKNCCRCNCLLCPFAFFTLFSLFAYLSFTFGLSMYLLSLTYVKNSLLIYDHEYVPAYITQAYQHNPWLFHIQQFGVSFYSLIVAYCLYLVVLVSASCITCRMEISPGWRGRYADSYEVLQMHNDANVVMFTSGPKLNTLEKNTGSKRSSKAQKAANLAEEERMSNLSEVPIGTTSSRSNKNNNGSRLLNDNQY